MKPAAFLAVLIPCLMFASASHAAPWRPADQAVAVSDRRIQECEDLADAKKLKSFEREKFIKECAKGND